MRRSWNYSSLCSAHTLPSSARCRATHERERKRFRKSPFEDRVGLVARPSSPARKPWVIQHWDAMAFQIGNLHDSGHPGGGGGTAALSARSTAPPAHLTTKHTHSYSTAQRRIRRLGVRESSEAFPNSKCVCGVCACAAGVRGTEAYCDTWTWCCARTGTCATSRAQTQSPRRRSEPAPPPRSGRGYTLLACR